MTDAVLITGAAKRIGAALARSLAADGWHVLVHYHASEAEAMALQAEIRAAGGRCDLLRADLSDRAQISGLIDRAVALCDRLVGLINNASHFEFDTIDTADWDLFDRHILTNLAAPVFLSQHFARHVVPGPKGEGAGVIVNVLDQKLGNLNPDFFTYTLAKAGLAAATRMMAQALAPRIRVCGIAPGLTLPSYLQSDDRFQAAHSRTPLGRGTQLADIVAGVRFLLSNNSITGEVVTIDAGESLTRRPRDVSFSED